MRELDKNMYFRAKHDVIETARILRKNTNFTENLLWEKLKGKQICGLRFRRQHPIAFFIADFYCHQVKLVVEVDGEIHKDKKEYDDGRTAEMERFGIQVIRFTNEEIKNQIDEVIRKIECTINERINNPSWKL